MCAACYLAACYLAEHSLLQKHKPSRSLSMLDKNLETDLISKRSGAHALTTRRISKDQERTLRPPRRKCPKFTMNAMNVQV
mmetsp:Transcript_47216/g.108546  ORF Transcript_47216/g.108546 Transcript_47216/m.108546 type:complete len:81 (-) Transcript_47216:398-640(-)